MSQTHRQSIEPRRSRVPKILVIDDELDVLRSTQMLLERLGYETVLLPEAEHLLAVIESERPDLILQDLMMPGLDMERYFETLQTTMKGAAPAVVLFSATGDLSERAAELDAAGYLHKPFAEQQLREVLER